MVSLPLSFIDGHLFVRVEGADWLVDTGAPASFGEPSELKIGDRTFQVADSYMGLNPATLSKYVGHPTAGIIGADVLGTFDTLFDVPGGTVSFSEQPMELAGEEIETRLFMGIPTVEVAIAGKSHRMVFDTGAKLSYLQDDALTSFPSAGMATDFYPGLGQFQTETFRVDADLGASTFTLRCGRLPELLGMALMMTGAVGIVGNEVLIDLRVGLLNRMNRLIINGMFDFDMT